VVRQLLDVGLLLGELLAQLLELLLLALADRVVLLGALASLEGVTTAPDRLAR
jgi:H+/Cl- antiporter ClcA